MQNDNTKKKTGIINVWHCKKKKKKAKRNYHRYRQVKYWSKNDLKGFGLCMYR